MQKLAGVSVKEEKESLNEHYVAGGIVGIGALNGGVPRKKSDYEMAFEHFIGEGYHTEKVDEAETAKGLLQMFKEKDLLNDRREYDIEDLMSAYPGLSKEEAKKLEQMLQNLDEAEEEIEEAKDITKMSVEEFMEEMLGPDYRKKPQEKQDMVSKVYNELKRVNSLKEDESGEDSSKSSASTLGKDLRNLGSSLNTKGIQGKEADNFIKFIKKALESIQTNNLNSDTIWNQLSAKLDTLAGEKSELKENEDDMPEAPSHEETDANQVYEEKINENYNPNRMLELIEMYVDNYFDEGMSAEAAIKKIDQLLQGNLDGYDEAFMAGKEDQY